MQQLPLAISPVAAPTLASFVPGDNAAVLAQVLVFAQACPAPFAGASATAAPVAPMYLWGPQGCGKTHLLRAVAALVADAGGLVGWFDASDPTPWHFRPDWALLVVDRCDHLDANAQHAAFVLFTEAVTHGVPWAAAGSLPPADLPLRDDLRTRLAWGHVFAVHALSEADTLSALNDEARRRGFQLPPEVASYLMSRFPRDLATLMALLSALDEHGLATQRRLTVPLVRDLIAKPR